MERNVFERLDQLEGNHWWFCARRKILKSAIAHYAPHSSKLRLLEAGCGTGGNLKMLSQFGALDAFELDDEARSIARAKTPIDVKNGMLPDGIPFAPGSYDVVAAFDVIEHVEQDVASLAKLGAQLAPGGRLLMTVPALPWLWSRHDVTHHHFRRYTRSQLDGVLRRAGLEPVGISYFNTLLFPAIAAARLVRKVLNLQGGHDDAMPSAFMNGLLKKIFGLESHFVGRISMPIGVSLLAVAKRAA
jgi:SAM-dependent methyltransferase